MEAPLSEDQILAFLSREQLMIRDSEGITSRDFMVYGWARIEKKYPIDVIESRNGETVLAAIT